jgi:hypothetical protein
MKTLALLTAGMTAAVLSACNGMPPTTPSSPVAVAYEADYVFYGT